MNMTSAKFRLSLVTGLLALASPLAAQTDATQAAHMRVAKLDSLLQLTPDQEARARAIFQREAAAMRRAENTVPRTPLFRIVETTDRDIRALLTADQAATYDRTPAQLGGGLALMEPAGSVRQLDREVGLSEAQKKVALAVFTEEFEALRQLPAAERSSKGHVHRQAAQDQIRTLLSEEQRTKRDNATGELLARWEKTDAALQKAVREAPAVVARVGPIVSVRPQGGASRKNKDGRAGDKTFRVSGERGSQVFIVSWRERAPDQAIEIVRISESGPLSP